MTRALTTITLLLIPIAAAADRAARTPTTPTISRDGTKLGLPSSLGGLTGFSSSYAICDLGTAACTTFATYYESTEAEGLNGPQPGATRVAEQIAQGGFLPLVTVALQRARAPRDKAEQLDEINHGPRVVNPDLRVTVGDLDIAVRGQVPARVTIWKGKLPVAERSFACSGAERTVISSAFNVRGSLYVEVQCPFSSRWERVFHK